MTTEKNESPEELARRARKRQAGRELLEICRAIRSAGPAMTEEEIQAEIDAYRAERRAKRLSPRKD